MTFKQAFKMDVPKYMQAHLTSLSKLYVLYGHLQQMYIQRKSVLLDASI